MLRVPDLVSQARRKARPKLLPLALNYGMCRESPVQAVGNVVCSYMSVEIPRCAQRTGLGIDLNWPHGADNQKTPQLIVEH